MVEKSPPQPKPTSEVNHEELSSSRDSTSKEGTTHGAWRLSSRKQSYEDLEQSIQVEE